MKKILRIKERHNVLSYVHYINPLSSILWNENKADWIHEHFTNIYLIRESNNYLWFDYLEAEDYMRDVCSQETMSIQKFMTCFSESVSLIDLIRKHLNEDFYLILFADSFYLKGTPSFQEKHEYFGAYLYGYDDETESLYGLGYRNNGTYGTISYSYDAFEEAVKSVLRVSHKNEIWIEWYMLTRLKMIDESLKYQYYPDNFIRQVEEFLDSCGDESRLRPDTILCRGTNASYGLNAQNGLIKAFDELYDDKYVMDYRYVYLLSEHKQLLYNKLKRYHEFSQEDFSYFVEAYNDLSKQFSLAKDYYLINVLKDNDTKTNVYGMLKNKKAILSIKGMLEKASAEEEELLRAFLAKVKENS